MPNLAPSPTAIPEPGPTNTRGLEDIRAYCRATGIAESTFGRLVVNDGKLVGRLCDGARITTATVERLRTYMAEHPAPSRGASESSAERDTGARPRNGAPAPVPPTEGTKATDRGFRFFDN